MQQVLGMLPFLLIVLRTVLLNGQGRGMMQKVMCVLLMLQGVHRVLVEVSGLQNRRLKFNKLNPYS